MKNKQKLLSVGIPVGPRALEYVKLAIETSINTAYNKDIIYYLCLDPLVNNDNYKNSFKQKFNDSVAFIEPPPISNRALKGGLRHGPLLDELSKNINSKYICLHDSDVAFLKQGWDDYMLSFLKDGYSVCGMESQLHDGWRDFPTSMIFMYEKKVFTDLDIKFSKTHFSHKNNWLEKYPEAGVSDERGWVNVTKENKHIWKREIGSRVYLETGFEMVPAYLLNGLRGHAFKCELKNKGNSRTETQWYLDDDGEYIATHMTRSRFRPFDKSPGSRKWLSSVREFLSKTS